MEFHDYDHIYKGILMFFNELKNSSLWEDWRNNFDVLAPTYLFAIVDEKDITESDINKAHELLEYYVGSVENINEENWQGMIDMFTDAGWLYGTHKMVNHMANHGVKVFQYIFTYQAWLCMLCWLT